MTPQKSNRLLNFSKAVLLSSNDDFALVLFNKDYPTQDMLAATTQLQEALIALRQFDKSPIARRNAREAMRTLNRFMIGYARNSRISNAIEHLGRAMEIHEGSLWTEHRLEKKYPKITF